MDHLGFLSDYLKQDYKEVSTDNVQNVGESVVDTEYNWHPVFQSQQSDKQCGFTMDDSFDVGEFFGETEGKSSAKDVVAESMVVNQRVESCKNKE